MSTDKAATCCRRIGPGLGRDMRKSEIRLASASRRRRRSTTNLDQRLDDLGQRLLRKQPAEPLQRVDAREIRHQRLGRDDPAADRQIGDKGHRRPSTTGTARARSSGRAWQSARPRRTGGRFAHRSRASRLRPSAATVPSSSTSLAPPTSSMTRARPAAPRAGDRMGADDLAFLARLFEAARGCLFGAVLGAVGVGHGGWPRRIAGAARVSPASIMCSTAGTKNGTSATTAAIPTHMNTENPTDITLNCGATRDTNRPPDAPPATPR